MLFLSHQAKLKQDPPGDFPEDLTGWTKLQPWACACVAGAAGVVAGVSPVGRVLCARPLRSDSWHQLPPAESLGDLPASVCLRSSLAKTEAGVCGILTAFLT